ncbi:MAG: redoxin family protein [Proteobacteria bacterium]|nr:redoxin family protein [Pseudomonadota bacterium]
MKDWIVWIIALMLGLPIFSGCSEDDDDDDTVSEDDSDSDKDSDPVNSITCSVNNGLKVDLEIAGGSSDLVEYRAFAGTEMPYDILRVQIFEEHVSSIRPGVYDLRGTNFSDCQVCVTILSGCRTGPCERVFYPSSGKVEITAIGGEGESFAAKLTNVEMKEVTIDAETFESTPVPDGEDWCVSSLSFDKLLRNSFNARCASPALSCVSETVNDFELTNCESGDEVSMHSLAENKKALMYVMVSVWCPACKQFVPYASALEEQYGKDGLDVIYVLGENAENGKPTLEQCNAYAATYNIDASQFYIDHNGEYSFFQTIWNMWPFSYETEQFGIPWITLIDAKTFKYVYTNQPEPTGDLEADMLNLLGL